MIYAIGVDFSASPGTRAGLALVQLAAEDAATLQAFVDQPTPVRLSPAQVRFCVAPTEADDPGYVVRGMLEDGHPLVRDAAAPDPSTVVEVRDLQAVLTSRGLRISAVETASGLPVQTFALPLP